MRNKITWTAVTILMIALCVCTLSACGQKEENSNPLPVPSLPIVSEKTEPEENNLHTDEEGLVQVSIENGSASISFDLARWDSLYGILQPSKAFSYQEGYMDPANLSEGPFPISGLTGMVKDAVIAQVEGLDWTGYPNFVTPAVILLMEDGSVEWLFADPYAAAVSAKMDTDYRPYTSYGRLPLIEKVHTLTYEAEAEGRGDFTVYAVTGDGLRYNLRLPCNMMTLFDDVWTCVLRSPMEQYAPPLYGYMTFYEDGNILFDVIEGSYYTGYPYESWGGKYELILAEDQLYPPGTIVFDMELNWWVYEWDEENDRGNQQYTPRIKGTYRFDAYAGGTLDLFLNDGDDLYPYKEENPEFYTFWFGDYVGWTDSFSNMTDEELVGWLISQVPEAYERIYTYGMTPLITGDYTQFTDGDVGRDIWLGTDSGGKFTREILYSIGMYGAIYEYDAVGDRWTLLYTVDMANEGTTHTLLAHVRFGEYLGEGVAQLLVDEVTWIDDPQAPNGYRIANDVEDWVPYIITEQTSIDLWRYDPAEGMVLSPEGLNEFIFELEEGWREGVMLAHVAVAEEIIQAIWEQYVP